jgi:hypothetical protein
MLITQVTVAPHAVRDAFDEMEIHLANIRGVAVAASMVIETELGRAAPARVLDALLDAIRQIAETSEHTRAATLLALQLPPD